MPIDTVVVAVGTGDQNRLEEVTETAIDIAGPANATVRLIHVFEREEYEQIREQLDIDPDSGVTPDEVAKRHVAIRELGDVIDAATVGGFLAVLAGFCLLKGDALRRRLRGWVDVVRA